MEKNGQHIAWYFPLRDEILINVHGTLLEVREKEGKDGRKKRREEEGDGEKREERKGGKRRKGKRGKLLNMSRKA